MSSVSTVDLALFLANEFYEPGGTTSNRLKSSQNLYKIYKKRFNRAWKLKSFSVVYESPRSGPLTSFLL